MKQERVARVRRQLRSNLSSTAIELLYRESPGVNRGFLFALVWQRPLSLDADYLPDSAMY
jgi:hypothetical protein